MRAISNLRAAMNSFVTNTSECAYGRTGILETKANEIRTPTFITHTLAGSVPHLTNETFDIAFPSCSPLLQISVDTTFTFNENVQPSGRTIAQFVGYPTSPSFLTVHNPLRELLSGFNDKTGISIWTRRGRQSLSVSKFIEIVNNFQPTFFQIPSDYDVNSSSSLKRIRKSLLRNEEYLCDVIAKTKTGAFATIEGAWFQVNPKETEQTLCKILEKQDDLQGFVINGVLITCDEVTEVNHDILRAITSHLPDNKPRFVPGKFTFIQIMEFAKAGIDLFDSSLVTSTVEDGKAFCLQLDSFLTVDNNGLTTTLKVNESLPTHSSNHSDTTTVNQPEVEGNLIDLKDKRYFDDFSPIARRCTCYTCRKFTRAYVHHLLATSELLAPVLLMMHNLHQFDLFFQALRFTMTDKQKFNELYNYLRI